jgi:Flp pilus assembly protein TadD
MVRNGLTWHGVRWAFGFRESNWHPLTWLSLMLDASLGGVSPRVFHVTNLLLHAANAVLLFLVLLRMTGRPWRSGFVSVFFAIHPLHVESVAWVAERKDVLSTLFWFLTMLAYASYVARPGPRRYAWIVAAFVAGSMSKPMLVTLPAILLLLDVWPLGRLAFPGRGRAFWPAARTLVTEKMPLFVLSAVSAGLTLAAQWHGGAVSGLITYPAPVRIENAIVSYAAYIGQMLWPARLSFFYPHPHGSSSPAAVFAAALLFVVATAVAFGLSRRLPYVLFGWLWYAVTLVPVIGIVQVGMQARADRYTYVPLVGLFVVLVWGASDLAEWAAIRSPSEGRARANRWLLAIVGCAVVAVLAVGAYVQAGYWHDSDRLYRRALELRGDNPVAHNNLAISLLDRGDADGAVEHAREALRLDPAHPEAPATLGNALARLGKLDDAVAVYRQAIANRPRDPYLHGNLAAFLGIQGKLDDAAAELREALRLDPESADAHENMGVVLARQGKYGEAFAEFAEALRIDPGNEEVRAELEQARTLRDVGERNVPK